METVRTTATDLQRENERLKGEVGLLREQVETQQKYIQRLESRLDIMSAIHCGETG